MRKQCLSVSYKNPQLGELSELDGKETDLFKGLEKEEKKIKDINIIKGKNKKR